MQVRARGRHNMGDAFGLLERASLSGSQLNPPPPDEETPEGLWEIALCPWPSRASRSSNVCHPVLWPSPSSLTLGLQFLPSLMDG